MRPLRAATVVEAAHGRARFALDGGWHCEVTLPAEGVGRVLMHPPDGLREPRTWAIAPLSGDDVPWEGRARTALFDDASLDVTLSATEGAKARQK